MDCFISYEGLPVNAGGAHRINSKTPIENYKITMDFLKEFADSTIPKDINLSITFSSRIKHNWFKLLLDLIPKYGIPKFRNDGYANYFTWTLNPKKINKAFEILNKYKFLKDFEVSPLSLNILWIFNFKDYKSGELLSGQDKIPLLDFRQRNSQLYMRLGTMSTVSAWFALPFNGLKEYEINYINELNDKLPFNPSKKHWRKWTKSKNDNWIPRKLELTPANTR